MQLFYDASLNPKMPPIQHQREVIKIQSIGVISIETVLLVKLIFIQHLQIKITIGPINESALWSQDQVWC